jgi:hypothetical protein
VGFYFAFIDWTIDNLPYIISFSGGRMKPISQEDFLKRAVDKWGSKFSYDLVDFQGMRKRVKITCPTHGIVEITPVRHLEGVGGCTYCGNNSPLAGGKILPSDFIAKCVERHGGFFDYSKVEFKGLTKGKILITCPHHGDFWQEPRIHINGVTGALCPSCLSTYRRNKLSAKTT